MTTPAHLRRDALTDVEMQDLQARLDALPAPLQPLDLSSLDGFLCGVLLQPRTVPQADWLRHVADVDGNQAPTRVDLAGLHALVLRRHGELRNAIAQRQWFDPWVYELEDEASPSDSVLPWVAGFATAMAFFPQLMQLDSPELVEPLATLYLHIDRDDLEDAEQLLDVMDRLEPPADMTEAVDDLVRCVLLMADVSLPRITPRAARAAGGARRARKARAA